MNWLAKDVLHQAIDKMMASVDRAYSESQAKAVKNVVDPFTTLVMAAKMGIKDERNLVGYQAITTGIRNISGAVGDFHQSILGSVDDWKDHDAGYDLVNLRRNILAEVKNKHNTMNASNRQKWFTTLTRPLDKKEVAGLATLCLSCLAAPDDTNLTYPLAGAAVYWKQTVPHFMSWLQEIRLPWRICTTTLPITWNKQGELMQMSEKPVKKSLRMPTGKRKRGRPEVRVLKIDATPEYLAKCLVTPIKKPK